MGNYTKKQDSIGFQVVMTLTLSFAIWVSIVTAAML